MYLPSPFSPLYHVSFGVAVGDSACVSVFVVLFWVLGCFIIFFSLWCLYLCGGCLGYLDVTYKLEMMTKYILEVLFLLFFLLTPL